MDNSKEAADGDRIQSPLSAEMLYGSLISQYRATGIATEEDEITKVNVGSKDIHSFEQDLTDFEDGEDKKAGASFDSIYSPYSTFFSNEDDGLPHFERPLSTGTPDNPANSYTLNPFNPNNELSLYYAPSGSDLWTHSLADTGAPTADELAKASSPSGWLQYGHNISMAVNGTGDRYSTDFDYQFTESTGHDVEVTNIRGVSLRAPMVLTGWGFDKNGKPVPNQDADDPGDTFASDAFKDPSLWKSGPVDFRWDDDRKVWSAGGQATTLRHGVIRSICDESCGTYVVEIIERTFDENCGDTGTGTGTS